MARRRRTIIFALFLLAGAQPLYAQDSTSDTTRARFQLHHERLGRLPIDDVRHALALVPGVRLSGRDIGVTPFATLAIRGNAAAAGNVYIDGAPLRFQTLGGAGLPPALNAVDTVGIVTGVADVALFDVAGGAIRYETASGTERWTGGVRWDSDEPFSNASSVGYNRLEGAFGGPLARNLTLALSTTLQGQQSSYRGPGAAAIPAYVPAGIDTTADDGGGTLVGVPAFAQASDGLRRPLDWSTARHAHAKVQYRGTRSTVSLTVLGGDVQQRFFPGQAILDSAVYQGHRLASAAAIANWQQELGTWHEAPLHLAVNLSFVTHRDITGPIDSTQESDLRDPALGIAFGRLRFAGANVLGLPASDHLIRDVRTNSGTRGVPFFGAQRLFQAWRVNPYGLALGTQGWWNGGLGGVLTDAAEHRVQGRVVVRGQWSKTQTVELGVDAEHSRVSYYSSDIVSQFGTDAFTAAPSRLGFFVADGLTIGDTRLDVGLRVDRVAPNGDLPKTPAFISSSGPSLWNPASATDDTAYANSVARVFRPARAQTAVAPRVLVSLPIDTQTVVRVGYSRALQPASWGNVFRHSNNDLSFTSVSDLFGSDVRLAAVSQIEAGVRRSFAASDVDLSVYFADIPQYAGQFHPVPDPRDSSRLVSVAVLSNVAGTQTVGVDAGLTWREGWLSGAVKYSLAHVSPQRSFSASYTTHDAAVAASLDVPAGWESETFVGRLARGASVVVLARAQTGDRYTIQQNNGLGIIGPDDGVVEFPAEPFNTSHLPWFKRLDLRIGKRVRTAGHDWSVYVDARNLLNFSNLIAVFAETGDTANRANRAATIGDTTFGTGEFGLLWAEATNAGALGADKTVDLTGCTTWGAPVNCVALNRVERRFGNGDQLFTLSEQQRTFEAYYRDFFGSWRFYAPGRTVRIGMSLAL